MQKRLGESRCVHARVVDRVAALPGIGGAPADASTYDGRAAGIRIAADQTHLVNAAVRFGGPLLGARSAAIGQGFLADDVVSTPAEHERETEPLHVLPNGKVAANGPRVVASGCARPNPPRMNRRDIDGALCTRQPLAGADAFTVSERIRHEQPSRVPLEEAHEPA
jgi:hypothetical protein